MNSKLGLAGAYNRRRTLSPLHTESPTHSKQGGNSVRLIEENKALKEKNAKLKEELQDVRSAMKQITSEASHEKVDERRINLIKFQVIQLERQISVMNEALGCRSEAIYEIENTMAWLADRLRSYVACEIKGPTVAISRSDLTAMIEALESSRIKLFKSVEKCTREEVGKDLLFLNPFLSKKSVPKENLSLIDISLQRFDFLNLQHVSALESKLCSVYKELIAVYEQLQMMQTLAGTGTNVTPEERRLMDKLLTSCLVVRDASDDLLALSLLCPSAPWPALVKPVTKEVPVDRVVAALPPLPRGKKDDVAEVVRRSVGVCNHRNQLLQKEKAALKEELDFHRSVYDLQAKYIADLFDALRGAYFEFEESARDVVCQPLQSLLKAYQNLKQSSSETTLRDFLLVVKEHEEQFASVVETFENNKNDHSGSEAFQAYTSDLMTKLDAIKQKCQQRRTQSIQEKRSFRDDQKEKEKHLQELLEELEAKYDQQWLSNSGGLNSRDLSRESLLSNTLNCDANQSTDLSLANDSQNSKTKLEDNPVILRSYIDEDSDWVSGHEDKTDPKTETSSEKPNSKHFDNSADDNSKTSSKKSSRKWKPTKKWVNDFTSPRQCDQVDNCEDFTSPRQCGEGDNRHSEPGAKGSDSRVCCPEDQVCNNARNSRPASGGKSYQPNLQVAQNSLKLKRKGNS